MGPFSLGPVLGYVYKRGLYLPLCCLPVGLLWAGPLWAPVCPVGLGLCLLGPCVPCGPCIQGPLAKQGPRATQPQGKGRGAAPLFG